MIMIITAVSISGWNAIHAVFLVLCNIPLAYNLLWSLAISFSIPPPYLTLSLFTSHLPISCSPSCSLYLLYFLLPSSAILRPFFTSSLFTLQTSHLLFFSILSLPPFISPVSPCTLSPLIFLHLSILHLTFLPLPFSYSLHTCSLWSLETFQWDIH